MAEFNEDVLNQLGIKNVTKEEVLIEKGINDDDLNYLSQLQSEPYYNNAKMVRIDNKNLNRASLLISELKRKGYKMSNSLIINLLLNKALNGLDAFAPGTKK